MNCFWCILKITIGLFFALAVLTIFALATAAGRADEIMGYKSKPDFESDRTILDDDHEVD